MTALLRRPAGFGVCVLAFLVLAGYELVRSPVESMFLKVYGSETVPAVWLAVALGITLVVVTYNRFAARLDFVRLSIVSSLSSALGLMGLLGAVSMGLPAAVFLLYVFKDVYIVVLVEVVWTFANDWFSTEAARRFYWVILVAGTLGSLVGGALVGLLAQHLGTRGLLALAVPLYVAVAGVVWSLGRWVGRPAPPVPQRASPTWHRALTLVRQSPYLGLLMLLVGVVQIVINLVDFQYLQTMETIVDVDRRSATMGYVQTGIAFGSLFMQVLSGPVLRWGGVALAMSAVPLLLFVPLAAYALAPSLAWMAPTKILSKVLDYSLFRASKEVLYIPLDYAQRTEGKALVDMLTYRGAKSGASVLLMLMRSAGLSLVVPYVTVGLVLLWSAVAWRIIRRYQALVGQEPS